MVLEILSPTSAVLSKDNLRPRSQAPLAIGGELGLRSLDHIVEVSRRGGEELHLPPVWLTD